MSRLHMTPFESVPFGYRHAQFPASSDRRTRADNSKILRRCGLTPTPTRQIARRASPAARQRERLVRVSYRASRKGITDQCSAPRERMRVYSRSRGYCSAARARTAVMVNSERQFADAAMQRINRGAHRRGWFADGGRQAWRKTNAAPAFRRNGLAGKFFHIVRTNDAGRCDRQ